MPRDYIHCYVAEQSAHKLKGMSLQLGDCLSQWRLGSVFPDAGFCMPYLLLGKRNSGSFLFPHDLHGSNGQDPGKLFMYLREGWSESGKPEDLAFVFGCASHFITDIIFHPFVYYHTGDYYDQQHRARTKAVFLHRVLETAMDVYLMRERHYGPFSMKGDWKAAKSSVRWACRSLEESGWGYPKGTFDSLLYKSVRLEVRLHDLFQMRPLANVMKFLRKGFKHHNTAALFYSNDYHGKVDCFAEKLFYVNPITGKPYELMFYELLDLAIDETVAYCKDTLWPYFDGDTESLDILPSLDFGIVGGRHGHLCYQSDRPITEKLL